jgi:putative tryptophan/tyrosine transport system substrate-binding protein
MRRREFITLLSGAVTAWPFATSAQQSGRVYRIGLLEGVSAALNAANLNAFRQGLHDLGYVEGQNMVIDYLSADGRAERFPDLAMQLVRLKVDVIATRGTPAVLAAKNATRTIPIVMVALADPLTVVASLAHPGGNVTGMSALTSELEPKRVELIREIVPGAERIAVLYNMANPVFLSRWQQMEQVAQSAHLKPQLLDVRSPEDIERAFDAASTQRVDALVVSNDSLTLTNRKLIAELAAKHRLPSVYASREFVEAGGLISYAVSLTDQYRRAAMYVDKILKGTKPSDLPVEQPNKLELVVNLKAAKALGLTVPPALLTRADEVIE